MGALITLEDYYNLIGKRLFPNWSAETINYLRGLQYRKKFKVFKKHAEAAQYEACKKILQDGKIKVSIRKEQGYIDAPFAIEDFNFPRSICSDKSGKYYPCLIDINIETRGRKKKYPKLNELVSEHVEKCYVSKGIPRSEIKAEAVIHHFRTVLNQPPSVGTIRTAFLAVCPECAKTTRNSKKSKK